MSSRAIALPGTWIALSQSMKTSSDFEREEQQLLRALQQLEDQLHSPVVPGELSTWVTQAKTAIDEVGEQLLPRMKNTHERQMKVILGEDQEMGRQVEKLFAERDSIREIYSSVSRLAAGLLSQIEAFEKHERKAELAVKQIVDEGLELVLRVRGQEKAIAVWLVEALQRDRGTVD